MLRAPVPETAAYSSIEFNVVHTEVRGSYTSDVYVFGTTDSDSKDAAGHSVCLRVANFRPYVDVLVPDHWSEDDADQFAHLFSEDHTIDVRASLRRARRFSGFIPDDDGGQKEETWVRLRFPGPEPLRKAQRLLRRRCDEYLRRVDRALDPYFKSTLGDATTMLSLMFAIDTKVVPSSWLRASGLQAVPSSSRVSSCQLEFRCALRDIEPVDREDIAPLVLMSFDLETICLDGDHMPRSHRPNDPIFQIGVSLGIRCEVAKRIVLCLGATESPPVENGDPPIELRCYDTEAELLDAFRDLIVAEDPDILTGWNIEKYDNRYLAERHDLFRTLRSQRSVATEAGKRRAAQTWEKCRSLVHAYEDAKTDDERQRVVRDARSIDRYFRPDRRNPVLPRSVQLIGRYESADEFARAVALYQRPGMRAPQRFYECSRFLDERSTIRCERLSSAAMGDQLLYRFPMTGRVLFDPIMYFKMTYRLTSYSLNSVSSYFLRDNKVDLSYDDMFAKYKSGDPLERGLVARYCSKDCDLPLRIMGTENTLQNIIMQSRVSRTRLTDFTTRGQSIRVTSNVTWTCQEMNYAMNSEPIPAPDSYVGAMVYEAESGYYGAGPHREQGATASRAARRNAKKGPVATLDYSSLYPSIMQAHNLSHNTLVPAAQRSRVQTLEAEGRLRTKTFRASNMDHVFVQSAPGLLSIILRNLLGARKSVKKRMKKEKDPARYALLDALQKALKVMCNSVYGVCGAKTGQMGCWPIAACTTALGQDIIRTTAREVEGHFPGAHVIYGDTDSVMVIYEHPSITPDKRGLVAMGRVAVGMADYITNQVFRDYETLVLEFEKLSLPYLLFKKKRYAAREFPDSTFEAVERALAAGEALEDIKLKCKLSTMGIEPKRRDNAKRLRDRYLRILHDTILCELPDNRVLTRRQCYDIIIGHVRELVQELVDTRGPLDNYDDWVISKELRERYKNPNLPQKRAVDRKRERVNRGEERGQVPRAGDRVAYVVVEGSSAKVYERSETVEWVQQAQLPIDRLYYLFQQFKRPLEKFTAFFADDDLQEFERIFARAAAVIRRERDGNRSLMEFFQPRQKPDVPKIDGKSEGSNGSADMPAADTRSHSIPRKRRQKRTKPKTVCAQGAKASAQKAFAQGPEVCAQQNTSDAPGPKATSTRSGDDASKHKAAKRKHNPTVNKSGKPKKKCQGLNRWLKSD